jgi:hypothetical protein
MAGALLGEIKAEDITSLAIRDDKGVSIRLARQGDPSTGSGQVKWVLPEADDYPADGTKITPVLTRLVGLKNNRLVTQTAASHKRLKVADDDFLRRLDLQTSGGASRTLYLGTSAGARATHVRVSGQDQVYLSGDLAIWDVNADSASWIDTAYFSVPQADVVAFTLGNANTVTASGGQWSLTKDAQGTWTLEGLAAGEQLDTNKVTALLNLVTSVRMTRPLGKTEQPAYGLTQPAAMVTLKTRKEDQEKTYTLTVGAQDAQDNSYVVKSSESPYYVRVAEYSVKELVEKKREDFLLVPTPTPATGPQAPTQQP